MKQINLSTEEREMLSEVLQSYLADLRYEIADTDTYRFKTMLKHRKEVMSNVLKTLEMEVQPAV